MFPISGNVINATLSTMFLKQNVELTSWNPTSCLSIEILSCSTQKKFDQPLSKLHIYMKAIPKHMSCFPTIATIVQVMTNGFFHKIWPLNTIQNQIKYVSNWLINIFKCVLTIIGFAFWIGRNGPKNFITFE